METGQARHETEESLIHKQLSANHQVPAKLQNGKQPPSPQQLNGDDSWSNFKPMKRHRDDCSSPVTMYDQGLYKINGEVRQALNEHSLVALHEPKKLCVNSETTGSWEKKDSDTQQCLDTNSVLNKPVQDRGNCNYPNGDIFSLSRNKQMPMPNGATVTPPSVESPAGDHLEKTQSQYYLNHTCITQDTSSLHGQVISSPSVTSGFPILGQTSASEPLARTPPEVHESNGYDPQFMVNGYSGHFGAEQPHRPLSFPLTDLPALENQVQNDLGKGPGISSTVSISDGSQALKGREYFHSNTVGLSMFSKSRQDFSQESYPVPEQAEVAGRFSSFKNSGTDQEPSTLTGQQHSQYGMQQHQSDVSCTADARPKGIGVSAPPPAETQAAPNNQCNELEHKLALPEQGVNVASDTQIGWIDLNSTPTSTLQHQDNQAHIWKNFLPNENTARESQGDLLNSDTSHIFQMQPGFPQQLESHMQNSYKLPAQPYPNAVTECQTRTPKTPSDMHTQPNMHLNNVQSQQHANEHFSPSVQQEQLCKNDQNQEQVLPPDSVHQRPSQSHQQYEAHQQQASMIHDAQGSKMVPQLQNPSQGQVNSQLQNRHTMEVYTQAEISPLTYRQSNATSNMQNGSNPSVQPMVSFSDQPRPNSQPSPNDMKSVFGYGGGAERQNQPEREHNSCLSAQDSQQLVSCHSQHGQMQLQQPNMNHGRQISAQVFPKTESQDSCFQFQRGPLPSPGSQGDFHRHAALRMHLLQKQERPNCPQSPIMIRPDLQLVKCENSARFETPLQMPPPQMLHQNQDLTRSMLPTVKQERISSTCSQSQHKSILATMEQQLQQYKPSSVFERRSLAIKSPNKMKVEMSGSLAVISTNIEKSNGDQCKPPASTPKKEPGLQCFLDSPMKLLDTPIKNLLDTPIKTQYEIPPCHCVEQISEKDEGPYYTHLGASPNVKGIREIMEKRSGLTGGAIRIEKVVYTGKEGKSTQGCPIAKWVIRRANVDEKLLVLVRERAGHTCETSCIVVAMVIWEGIPANLADRLYTELSDTLTKHGTLTNRRCAHNEERTCACQGRDPDACGASFSFGCSWSMYYNGCKFARSKIPRKFKLLGDDPKEEERLERDFQALATLIAPVYKKMAPDAYGNQVEHEHRATDCRLGLKEGRPFSGVTACLDFCAHAHRDLHNMAGGSTVVCTLTKEDNREIGKIPDDEQLHVLPLYRAASTDEFGSSEAQLEKTRTGAIQVLSTFRRQVRMLAEPAKSCRQRKLEGKKGGANKPSHLSTSNPKTESTQQAKQQKQSPCDNVGQNIPTAVTHLSHMGTSLLTGQKLLAGQNQLQQQNQQSQPSTAQTFSSPTSSANYQRHPNTPGSFASTSKPPNMFFQSPSSASPYHSPLPVPNTYMNGSNPPSSYPGALTPNNLYPGYQCNGAIPMDSFHPYYSNPKHIDLYRQRPSLYPDQQFTPQQHYGMNFPSQYGEPGLHVNGYSNCNMRPNMHPIGHYPGYSSNGGPNAQFLDAISRPPPAQLSLDSASANKCSQFGRYPNPHLTQNHHLFPQSIDPRSTRTSEMSLHRANIFPQVLSSVSREGMNPSQTQGMSLPNGNIPPPSMVKQEPGIAMPVPQAEEDAWSDNEHNFLDPEIGGVAVAPSHGSILIECARRELHATTPLKKPDRTHPTRISLVFYQHKNLNEAKHGLALWEAKMAEKAREKEEDAEKHGTDGTPSKSGGKRVKKEHPEPSEPSTPPYRRFVQMLAENSLSCTTNTYVSSAPYAFTKVTGPYSHFL